MNKYICIFTPISINIFTMVKFIGECKVPITKRDLASKTNTYVLVTSRQKNILLYIIT